MQPPKSATPKRYARRIEVAERLSVSTRFLDKLVAQGRIPASRIGRAVLFDLEDVDNFVKSQRMKVA